MDFTKLKERMEEIAQSWNGEDPGISEERATTALEVLDSIKSIEENLEFLSN